MKKVLLMIIFFNYCFGLQPPLNDKNSKPNIIVIFTDDQGYSDIGVHQQVKDVKTPNIDKMASEGVTFKYGYCTAPQCTPSRAGLLTGRYQQKFGLDENGTIPLPLDEIIIPQRLKKAGYISGMTGKWHLEPNRLENIWIRENMPALAKKKLDAGIKVIATDIPYSKKIPYMPCERGFDECFQGEMIHYRANYDLDGNDINSQSIIDKRFRIDVQTDATLAFIEKNHEKPFFFFLSYFGPHVPLEATEYYLRRFEGEMPERRRYALAIISAIDDGVGDIRKKLVQHNILDNTIIFFVSDNGAPLKMNKKDLPISYKLGAWDGSLNDPLVGEKGMLSEGGIRVPFILSWPEKINKGVKYNYPVSTLDIAATTISAAGLKIPKILDGVDLIPFLTEKNKGIPHEYLYWRFWDQAAILNGKFKFLKAGEREFLFDISSPLPERKNLITQKPKYAKKLSKELVKWSEGNAKPGISKKLDRESDWFDFYFH